MPRKRKQQILVPESDYDVLVERIGQCQKVVDELKNSEAWKVVLADAAMQCKQLDDNWQSIFDIDKLQVARVLKMAMKHIVDLPKKYQDEFDSLQKQKKEVDNIENEIPKDYDGETNAE